MKKTVLFAAKCVGLFWLSRWLLRKRLLILCYHGFEVRDEADFRPLLFIRPTTFHRRMEMLARGGFTVLPLDEAMRRLGEDDLPSNTVVITIDDGFSSVKQIAQPQLARYGFASTLYATSNRIALGTPVFRLVVQYIFWKTTRDTIDFDHERWVAPGHYDLTDAGSASRLCARLIEVGEQDGDETTRDAICRELGDKLDVDYDDIVRSGMLTHVSPDDLSELDRSGMDVQLHTHTHKLTHGGEPMIQYEISSNARLLHEWVGKQCRHFCYPHGEWHPSYLGELAQLGVETATTCEAGWNEKSTNRLTLYRFLDGENISDLQFEAEVYGFSELLRIVCGRRRKRNRYRQQAAPEDVLEPAGAARE